MKIAILGTRGIPNNYGGFEQCAEYLSIGLVERGHEVSIYNPAFHPYKKEYYKGVKIISKPSPQKFIGASAANFIYDFYCLKDAINSDVDIILELGLITSALSIIFCRHKGKIIVTNLDGLEWKRSKWNWGIQKITKTLERYGLMFSDYIISDNIGIQEYIKNEYNKESYFIPYGTSEIESFDSKVLLEYNLEPYKYLLSIARIEPENNLEIMIEGYLKSNSKLPYIIIGNHLTPYADNLKDKYRNKGVFFLGGIFNKNHLDILRYFSKFYIHGHSVGGTNPALLEAMAAQAVIFSHRNKFNYSVIEDNAEYFSSALELSQLINKQIYNREDIINNNLVKIKEIYNWDYVICQYEEYFSKIMIKEDLD
ncbi:MAG: DUF1972 domain-containing protein [Bacteroidota bacterium]|nr:DUF1972 domain-containing protein [Bacteroidota bacterium]